MERKKNPLPLLLLAVVFAVFEVGEASHEINCASMVSADFNAVFESNAGIFPNNNMYNKLHGAPTTLSGVCPGGAANPINGLQMYGFTVKNHLGQKVPLLGYYHLSLDFTNDTAFSHLVIQAETYHDEGQLKSFGEFVPDFPLHGCPNSEVKPQDNPVVRDQFVLCPGLNDFDQVPSNMFVYNRDSNPVSPFPKRFHIVWRWPEHFCFQVHLLYFRVGIVYADGRAFRNNPCKSVIFLEHGLPPTTEKSLSGAADPMPLAEDMVGCLEHLHANQTLYPALDHFVFNVINNTRVVEKGVFNGDYSHSVSARHTKGGQLCYANYVNYTGLFTEYIDHVDVTRNLIANAIFCLCPPLPIGPNLDRLTTITPTTTTPTTTTQSSSSPSTEKEDNRKKGIPADRPPGNIIWNFRGAHGIAMIIATVLVTPVSTFVSRYYKETFTGVDIMFNRVWYMVHIIAVFANFQLHVYGGASISRATKMLGHNKDPVAGFHRMSGWFVICLFVCMSVFGGIRPLMGMARKVVISLHWVFGTIYYLLSLFACVTSIFIYGSPSDTVGQVMTDGEQKLQWILLLIVTWFIFDIICNIIMTIHGCSMDKKNAIKRLYLPVPMPVIAENTPEDFPGGGFRKAMLLLYFGVAFVITTAICMTMKLGPNRGRGFGIMTCSHNENNEFVKISDSC